MTIRETVTIDDVIKYLNELVYLDRKAIETLSDFRVDCNEKIANHPTVQVVQKDNKFSVGLIGLLNGLFGIREDGWGEITAVYIDDMLWHFERTDRK